MNTPTATPRTDAALYPMNGVEIVWPDFARTLETELAEAKAERETVAEASLRSLEAYIDKLKQFAERAEKAEAEVERLKELLRIESASAQHALAAAERAEADSARLDWLLDRSAQTYHSYSNHLGGGNYVQYHHDRAAIDAAMKP